MKEKKGQWVSGESLTQDLGVSRAAICKHIKKLREQGYDIASSTKKGYFFAGSTDRLLAPEIAEGLTTRTFGKRDIHYFQKTDSTNIRAKVLAAHGAVEGTLVVAEQQTHGKGRRARRWFSPEGDGIYISVILRPLIPASEAARITLMTAVAVADALLSLTDMRVTIKWPNDILVNGKKLAGILTEMSTEMDSIDYVVVGLGLNVHTPLSGFPKDLRGKATSILAESGRRFSRVVVVRAFLEHFERYFERLTAEGFEGIIARWKALADVIGRRVRVELIGRQFQAMVEDVDSDGTLIVRDDKGQSHRVLCGDLIYVDPH